MIKCDGQDVFFNGKRIACVQGGEEDGFYLLFKAGRTLWMDPVSGDGQFRSRSEIVADIMDRQYRENIIVASFTGSLPVCATVERFLVGAMRMGARGGQDEKRARQTRA